MGPQPTCVSHPDRPAARACARCGDFVCSGCLVSGDLCSSCKTLLNRQGVPYSPEEKARASARRCLSRATRGIWSLFGLALAVVALLFFFGGGAHAALVRLLALVLAGLGVVLGLAVASLSTWGLSRSRAGRPGPGVAGVFPLLTGLIFIALGLSPGVLAFLLLIGRS